MSTGALISKMFNSGLKNLFSAVYLKEMFTFQALNAKS